MLFDKKHQKKIRTVWIVISIIMILGMILLYLPALYY